MNYICQKNSKLHNIGKTQKSQFKTSSNIQNQAKKLKSSDTPLQRRAGRGQKATRKMDGITCGNF